MSQAMKVSRSCGRTAAAMAAERVPGAAGELGESGAWRVVRELAQALTRCSQLPGRSAAPVPAFKQCCQHAVLRGTMFGASARPLLAVTGCCAKHARPSLEPSSSRIWRRGSDEFPELKDMQTLPLQELAVRLCYKCARPTGCQAAWPTRTAPLPPQAGQQAQPGCPACRWQHGLPVRGAAHAALVGQSEAACLPCRFDDGQKEPIVDSEVEGADDGAVTAELLDKLQRYLHFSNLIYEAPTDRTLQRLLGDQGFVLNYSKLESDWEVGRTWAPPPLLMHARAQAAWARAGFRTGSSCPVQRSTGLPVGGCTRACPAS